jgi:hypothetical protein
MTCSVVYPKITNLGVFLEHLDLLFSTEIYLFLHRPLHVPFLRDFGHAIRTYVYVHYNFFSGF